MVKKIVQLLILIILASMCIENVRLVTLNYIVYPIMYNMADGNKNDKMKIVCGQIKLSARKYDEALKLYKEIITDVNRKQFAPEKADAYYYLGNTYYMIKEYPQAEEAYKTALATDAGHKKALKKLSRIKFAKEDYVGLAPYISAYVKQKPKDAFGYSELCATATRLDKISLAMKACEKSIQLHRGYSRAYYDYGDLYKHMGFETKAKDYYNGAKRRQPKIKSREELAKMLDIKREIKK